MNSFLWLADSSDQQFYFYTLFMSQQIGLMSGSAVYGEEFTLPLRRKTFTYSVPPGKEPSLGSRTPRGFCSVVNRNLSLLRSRIILAY